MGSPQALNDLASGILRLCSEHVVTLARVTANLGPPKQRAAGIGYAIVNGTIA